MKIFLEKISKVENNFNISANTILIDEQKHCVKNKVSLLNWHSMIHKCCLLQDMFCKVQKFGCLRLISEC